MYCQKSKKKKEKERRKKNMSHRRGFYLYVSCACQHQTFNVSVLQRHRRKEREMQGSHCHHTIKQSSAPPNSLQLSSAGTRHSHYNKHSLLMLRLHRHNTHRRGGGRGKKKILRLIDWPDSWKIKVRARHATKQRGTHMREAGGSAESHPRHQYFGGGRRLML